MMWKGTLVDTDISWCAKLLATVHSSFEHCGSGLISVHRDSIGANNNLISTKTSAI